MKRKYLVTSIIIISILVAAVVIYITREQLPATINNTTPDDEIPARPEPPRLFGLNKDSFHVSQSRVARDQNLTSILLARNVGFQTIQSLVQNSEGIFNVRNIRAGNPYTFFFNKDSIQTPAYFVYQINDIDYMVMQLYSPLKVYRGQKPVKVVEKKGQGQISSSLWNTIVDNNMNPLLAIELSEIFAWTVDFFGIEKGDEFKVIYNESYVDSTAIGIESIAAAIFTHRGRNFYAFRFMEDSTYAFFDEEGNSLRKTFLKAPLRFSRISSRFTRNRFHPILRINRPHFGVDYAAPEGTPVYAIGDGVIVGKGWDSNGGGNFIRIRHNSVYTTLSMHLRNFARGIERGQHVRQGQVIGYVGSTGLATGPHLCFRVYRNGVPVDPLRIESTPVNPVREENMERFNTFIAPLKSALDEIGHERVATGAPAIITTSQ